MDLTKCLNEKEICSKGLAKHYVMPELKLQVHVFKSIAVAYRDKISRPTCVYFCACLHTNMCILFKHRHRTQMCTTNLNDTLWVGLRKWGIIFLVSHLPVRKKVRNMAAHMPRGNQSLN